MGLRTTTILNKMGDTTLVWTEDRDDEMEAVIAKKMAAGVTFFLIDPRFGTRRPLKKAEDAIKHRVLAIPDADFALFVGEGKAQAVKMPAAPIKVRGRAKTAKEAARAETVAVAPRRGG